MERTAVITGASRGIGREVALLFARRGYNTVVNYRSKRPAELAEIIESHGVKCLLCEADVSVYSEAEAMIKSAKEVFGRVDALVNNAGITRDGLIMRMSEDDFDAVINTNLKGAFNTIKAASGIMLKQRSGAIVNISSVVGVMGNAGQANYAASKAGLIGLTKSCAKELGSRGITCNAIAPGFIETDMTSSLSDEVKAKMLSGISLGRFGGPAEVAEAVYFLANSSYITGQVLSVCGGML